MDTPRIREDVRRDGGIALMLTVLLLIAVSALALSTMQTAASDGTVAGFQNQEQIAFYAAEAGIADARAVVRNMGERSQVPNYPADFPNEANPETLSNVAEFVTEPGWLSLCVDWVFRFIYFVITSPVGFPLVLSWLEVRRTATGWDRENVNRAPVGVHHPGTAGLPLVASATAVLDYQDPYA